MKSRYTNNFNFLMILFFAALVLSFSSNNKAQGRIAYTAFEAAGIGEIFIMNPDGSGKVNLSNNPAKDEKPSFTRYGNKIAFRSDRDGNYEIYVMSADGSGQTRLTNTLQDEDRPIFSPNGTKIVFYSERDGNREIYVMNADGSNQTRLTNNTYPDMDPSFSPDGTKIIFSSSREGDSSLDLYTMNADGTGQTRLVNFAQPYIALQAKYTPDGTKIIFASTIDDQFGEIYSISANGTGLTRLTTSAGNDSEASFNPDGSKIVYFSQRTNLSADLYLMSPDGSNNIPLTLDTASSEDYPSWGGLPLDSPPELHVTSVTPINSEGQSVTVSGNVFSPDITKDFTLSIDWGDGTQQNYNYPAGTTTFAETHQYLDDYPFGTNINLLLSTANGSNPATVPLTGFANVPPNLSAAPDASAFTLGSPASVHGTISDPGTLDTHTVAVNWGDGSQATSIDLAAGVSNFSASHVYASVGAYTITVAADDDDGGVATPVNRIIGVVPPPTLGKIAFTSSFAGNNNIYLMNSNGTGAIALTTNPASDAYPNLSKDGSKIVFSSDRDGNQEIYSMNAVGSFQTRLTNNAAIDTTPVFSPDGTKIVFASNRDGNYEIYIMNANGIGQTRLTNNVLDDGQATFSPDGTKIYFVRLASNQSDSHIWSMDLNGANQVALTSGSFILNGQPNFSPNGQKIVFSSVRPFSNITQPEVFIMDANGANQTRLTTAAGQDLEPVFSPDGTKIAFRSERDGNAEIYLMDANGANQQRITFDGAGVSNFAPSWAAVSTVSVDIDDNLAAESGTTLTMPIIATDTTGKGIVSYDFTLNYDPAVLTPQPVAFDKTSTLSAGLTINAGVSMPGKLVVSGFGSVPLTGAGTLLKLKFNVVGTAPTSSNLTLSPFMFNEGIPFSDVAGGRVFVQGTIDGRVTYGTAATTVGVPNVMVNAVGSPNASTTTAANGNYHLGGFGPGAYTVTPTKTGDNNGISALDASLISQFLVGATTLTANQQAAGEVSGNGSLTSFDAALIAQYVAQLPNTGLTGTWRFLPVSRTYESVGSLINEDYTAILMGEVSGDWSAALAGFSASLNTATAKKNESGLNDTFARPVIPTATVALGSGKVKQNQSISVPIAIKFSAPVAPVQAYQFDVLFDPKIVQPDVTAATTTGTLSSSFSVVTNPNNPGRLRVVVYGAASILSNGTLINLIFRAVGRTNSSTNLSFANLLLNEGSPVADGKSGKITVSR